MFQDWFSAYKPFRNAAALSEIVSLLRTYLLVSWLRVRTGPPPVVLNGSGVCLRLPLDSPWPEDTLPLSYVFGNIDLQQGLSPIRLHHTGYTKKRDLPLAAANPSLLCQ